MPQHPDRHRVRYGARHQALRKRMKRLVQEGGVVCVRCQRPIAPDEPFDLDHAPDGYSYLGASHRRCNRVAGGKTRARQLFGAPEITPPAVTSRRW